MPTTIDRLRDLSTHCRRGEPLPPDLAGWLAAGIERFLGREAKDLDGALGLIQAQGGIPWWREDAIRRRDQALRRLWQSACPGAGITARARRVAELLKRGATVTAHDPVAMDEARRVLGDAIGYAPTPETALTGADALLVVTEWKAFRSPDFEAIKAALKQPVIFDGRNLYEPALMRQFGIEHHGIGRGLR